MEKDTAGKREPYISAAILDKPHAGVTVSDEIRLAGKKHCERHARSIHHDKIGQVTSKMSQF